MNTLLFAIHTNNLNQVIAIIEGRNSHYQTDMNHALLTAVLNCYDGYRPDYKDAIWYLLKKGAKANVLAHCGDVEVAQMLLQHGADINKRSNDATGGALLHNAVIRGKLDLIQFALENGGDVNLRSAKGLTPLQHLPLAIDEFPIFSCFNVESQLAKKVAFIQKKNNICALLAPFIIKAGDKTGFFELLALMNKKEFHGKGVNMDFSEPKFDEKNHISIFCKKINNPKKEVLHINVAPRLHVINLSRIDNKAAENCLNWIKELMQNKPCWLDAKAQKGLEKFIHRLECKIQNAVSKTNFGLFNVSADVANQVDVTKNQMANSSFGQASDTAVRFRGLSRH